MDPGGSSKISKQERRGVRHVWTKEEEEALLGIMNEIVATGGCADCGSFKFGTLKNIELRLAHVLPNCGLRSTPHIKSKLKTWKKQYGLIYNMINTTGFGWNDVRKCVEVDSNEAWHSYVKHHKQAEGWRDKSFPLYERLSNIFRKDRATGQTACTLGHLAADVEMDDNFDNDNEIVRDFSPILVNQTDSNLSMNQVSSQQVSRKRSRSGEPIVSSMDQITNVMKDAVDKTTHILDKICQILAKSKVNENRMMADDLQKMQLTFLDRVRVMQKFMQKPEIAETFKAEPNEEQKLQLVAAVLSGEFDV